ncbi:hypothetical protein GIB67_035123 [Kingdonia uniflora]|uniref:Uncharacterized protein n=1 Tax=Kingdonia uniflora TaxID=39325 RepID=A0A7J7NVG4_9MAGN|nr:hypothetical protein GIB67_035123 [Kingdonia uniflora]
MDDMRWTQVNENEEYDNNKKNFTGDYTEVDVTLKKWHTVSDEDNNERAFKIACQMSLLHAHLDELLPGVLLESFIQRPISQDEKN